MLSMLKAAGALVCAACELLLAAALTACDAVASAKAACADGAELLLVASVWFCLHAPSSRQLDKTTMGKRVFVMVTIQ